MVTSEQIEGGWTELKGKVKQRWGQLTDDELQEFEGSLDELVGMVQQKTGEARVEIENWLREVESSGLSVEKIREQVTAGQAQVEAAVQRRPVESVAVAFGVGILAGVVVGLMSRGRA